MGGRRKSVKHTRSHSNKYQKYSKAEKIMEKQINKEICGYIVPKETITEPEVDVIEEEIISETADEFEVPYYKNVKSYEGDIRRGEIYFFDKGPKVGVEQQGGRPGIIVSNNLCNEHSEFVEVVYTTCQPKTELPTHITISSTPKPCIALCEQIHTLSKKKILHYYGEITAEEEVEINNALAINLSLPQDIKHNKLKEENIQLKLQLDAALEANQGYEQEAQVLTKEIQDLSMKLTMNISPSNEGAIYKKLYHDLLDKVLKLKLQEEK
jgi:mRNA interferase MazF